MKLTEEQILAAADAVDATGETPTIDNVRAQLGNKGSYSTIGPALKKWTSPRVDTGPAEPLPASLAEMSNRSNIAIWKLAQSIANGRYTVERQEMTVTLAEKDLIVREAMGVADQKIDQLDEANRLQLKTIKENERLQRSLGDAKNTIVQQQTEIATMAVRQQETELRLALISDQLLAVMSQHSDLIQRLTPTAPPPDES